jgi:hypothetical protein
MIETSALDKFLVKSDIKFGVADEDMAVMLLVGACGVMAALGS